MDKLELMTTPVHTWLGLLIAMHVVGLIPWKSPPPLAQVLYCLILYGLIGYGIVLLWVS